MEGSVSRTGTGRVYVALLGNGVYGWWWRLDGDVPFLAWPAEYDF